MTVIYSPSSAAILALVAAMSVNNSSAFTQVQQLPKFATRTMSPMSSSLSMVGSDDYLNLLGNKGEGEKKPVQDEAWMPQIPTPGARTEMVVDTRYSEGTAPDAFVQEEFEAAAAAMALDHEETASEERPESVVFEETSEPVVMIIEEVEESVTLINELDESSVDQPEPIVEAQQTIPRSRALVQINEETLEFTSGVVGGVVGFALAGPVGSVVGSTICNFFSRQVDGDITEAINNTAKKSIELYNYLAKLDAKYDILNGSKQSLTRSIEKIKSSGNVSPEAQKTVKKLEARLDQVGEKIDKVNSEYDITTNVLLALDKFGDIVERTVKKSIEFENKNGLAGKLVNAWSTAIEKALEAADDTKRKSTKS